MQSITVGCAKRKENKSSVVGLHSALRNFPFMTQVEKKVRRYFTPVSKSIFCIFYSRLAYYQTIQNTVLTFYPTRQIFLPRLTAHARNNIVSYFLR